MTREEAIRCIQDFIGWFKEDSLIHKALKMAIKALSQEPCEDAVSRNQSNACSILDDECPYPYKHCWECPLNYQYKLAMHELDKNVELPSVTQKSGSCSTCEYDKNGYCYSDDSCNYQFGDSAEFCGIHEEQKSGKWIPFSERLPKPFEHCLITTTDGEVIYHYDDGHYSKYKAWMPLPKPYEPQESEE